MSYDYSQELKLYPTAWEKTTFLFGENIKFADGQCCITIHGKPGLADLIVHAVNFYAESLKERESE